MRFEGILTHLIVLFNVKHFLNPLRELDPLLALLEVAIRIQIYQLLANLHDELSVSHLLAIVFGRH